MTVIYDGLAVPAALSAGISTVPLPRRLTMLPVIDEVTGRLDQAKPRTRARLQRRSRQLTVSLRSH